MRRKSGRSLAGHDDSDLINLTPLLDVLFVILVMFMLFAPLINLDRVELAEASREKQELNSDHNNPIRIYVRDGDTIWLKERLLSEEDFGVIMKKLHELYPQTTPEVYIDKKVSFGLYQKVKNRVQEGGFEAMDLVLKNES